MTWLDALIAEGTGKPGGAFDPTLEALCSGLPPEDAHELRLERAAILEHEAGLPQVEADRLAGVAPPTSQKAS